jgi:2',3'-cyclic-nucleotide 2'-phosphodiesterase (5'-nucleotidase family)
MHLKIQQIVVFITIGVFFSCKENPLSISEIRGRQLPITDSLPTVDSLEAFVAPYRERVNEVLDSTLAYAPHAITKTDGAYNTTAGNLMADVVLQEANPIFRARTGREIDFVLLNHGGIRSVISPGPVSARTAYQVMPFDNTIVVAEMNGKAVRELVAFLIQADMPHPIAGIQIVMGKDKRLQEVNIQGVPFDENRNYYIATSSYLTQGGDDMVFFRDAQSLTETDYYIRNALIDYFKKVDTLNPKLDDRFIKKNSP